MIDNADCVWLRNVVARSSPRILDPRFVLTAPALSNWLAGIVTGDPPLRGRHRVDIQREDVAALADRNGPLGGQIAAIRPERPDLAPRVRRPRSSIP